VVVVVSALIKDDEEMSSVSLHRLAAGSMTCSTAVANILCLCSVKSFACTCTMQCRGTVKPVIHNVLQC
jgi:hypothetical protein